MTSAAERDKLLLFDFIIYFVMWHTATLPLLTAWFSRHGSNVEIEIEARIRGGIDAAVFNAVLAKLRSFNGWSSATVEDALDVSYDSETRATFRAGAQAPTFITKDAIEARIDVDAMAGKAKQTPISVRMACVAERSAPPPPLGYDHPRNFRFKRRHKFARKGEFVFDLTEVHAGATREAAAAAPSTFEFEVEWIGQSRAAEIAGKGGPQFLAEKFLAKVQDGCDMIADAMRGQHGEASS
jgi:hypothetical protein